MNEFSLVTAPEFYQGYLENAKARKVSTALRSNNRTFRKFLKSIPKKKWDHAYADGKWTVKQVIQHVLDAERVFCLRALWFARQPDSVLPGFDENKWATQATAAEREPREIIKEFISLRRATQLMFETFTTEELQRKGIIEGNPVSVAALGYITAGHTGHHLNILLERYMEKSPIH
ncbi:MAG: hypothetical protein RL732_471 [Bacteroidota bacterium]